jgi:Trk K+ transport system NAD-binding subunit
MNIAIIGCGYVGYAVGQFWQQKTNFFITATTTSPERVPTLKTIAQKVIVTQGNDPEGLKAVLENQDIVLLSVGAKGVNLYEATYLKTAENLVKDSPDFPTIKQIIYTVDTPHG